MDKDRGISTYIVLTAGIRSRDICGLDIWGTPVLHKQMLLDGEAVVNKNAGDWMEQMVFLDGERYWSYEKW